MSPRSGTIGKNDLLVLCFVIGSSITNTMFELKGVRNFVIVSPDLRPQVRRGAEV